MPTTTEAGHLRLVEPFPLDQSDALYRWLRVSVIGGTPSFPAGSEAFAAALQQVGSAVRSWAVYDKGDGALIGIVLFEPVGLMGGRCYVASARRAWGTGLMDEAARLGFRIVFDEHERLDYIFGFVLSSNGPALAFDRRIGMRLKNIMPQYSEQGGKLRDLHIFEITREQWSRQQIGGWQFGNFRRASGKNSAGSTA